MNRAQKKSKQAGFTFVEVLAAVAIGTVVVAAMFMGLAAAMNQASMITRRAAMQQNLRTALNSITGELELAGTGFSTSGVALPPNFSGTTAPQFGYDSAGTRYLTGGTVAPLFGNVLANSNTTSPGPGTITLFAINPERGFGPPDMTGNNSDAVTLVYVDPNFPALNIDAASITSNGTVATFTIGGSGSGATQNTNGKYLDDTGVGMQPGDIMLFSGTTGSAVVEVTSLTPAGSGTANVAHFAVTDPLHFNVAVSGSNNTLGVLATGGTFAAYKLNMITYYLHQPDNANGSYLSLMRQLNARTPAPVADNVSMLQITYDTFNGGSSTTTSNEPNADMRAGVDTTSSPQQIRKVNVWVGVRSLRAYHAGPLYDNMTMGSTISPRNLDYINRY